MFTTRHCGIVVLLNAVSAAVGSASVMEVLLPASAVVVVVVVVLFLVIVVLLG